MSRPACALPGRFIKSRNSAAVYAKLSGHLQTGVLLCSQVEYVYDSGMMMRLLIVDVKHFRDFFSPFTQLEMGLSEPLVHLL